MKIMDKSIITEKLKKYFIARDEIKAAYIFGSYAKGMASNMSDVDIALLYDEKFLMKIYLLDIMNQLSSLLGKDTDVVILNHATSLVSHQVRKHGELILDRDPSFRKQFEIKQRKFYEDYLHLHEIYMNKVRKQYG